MQRSQFVFVIIWSAAILSQTDVHGQEFDLTSVYKKKSIQGFTVLINPEVLKHKKDAVQVQQELEFQLKAIVRVMPAKPISILKKVRIWVEWKKKKDGAAEFHYSESWLRANGYNPEKAGCVELGNTRNFVWWSRDEQPWLLFHELAHSYQHFKLGRNNKDINVTYKNAVDRKLYDSVDHINGNKGRAYALTDAREYFAELSEAYFGKNDYYPFTRTDLKKHDSMGYQLMEKSWGKLKN